MVWDDMESGIVTSYKNKGIIIPELISLPFFKSTNICLNNCFLDKFSLRAFILRHTKFLKTRNLHLFGSTLLHDKVILLFESYVLYWLHHDSLYTKGFYCNIFLYMIDNV